MSGLCTPLCLCSYVPLCLCLQTCYKSIVLCAFFAFEKLPLIVPQTYVYEILDGNPRQSSDPRICPYCVAPLNSFLNVHLEVRHALYKRVQPPPNALAPSTAGKSSWYAVIDGGRYAASFEKSFSLHQMLRNSRACALSSWGQAWCRLMVWARERGT